MVGFLGHGQSGEEKRRIKDQMLISPPHMEVPEKMSGILNLRAKIEATMSICVLLTGIGSALESEDENFWCFGGLALDLQQQQLLFRLQY